MWYFELDTFLLCWKKTTKAHSRCRVFTFSVCWVEFNFNLKQNQKITWDGDMLCCCCSRLLVLWRIKVHFLRYEWSSGAISIAEWGHKLVIIVSVSGWYLRSYIWLLTIRLKQDDSYLFQRCNNTKSIEKFAELMKK